MEYFFILFSMLLISIIVSLYRKLLRIKQSYDIIRGEIANKISEFSILAEKCKQESQKFQEVSARNINLTGQYQELLRVSRNQNSSIDGLNLKINDLLAKQAAEIKNARIDANTTQRAVVKGKVSEEIVGLLPGFPYKISNMRFCSAPVDFIIFNDLENENITEVIFLEVKTGQAVLNKRQRQIKQAIDNKNVKFEVYRIEDINNNNTENNESN